MKKISRNFMGMWAKKLVIFGQNVEGKMTREAGVFSNPTPTMGEMSSVRQSLETAIVNAEKGGLVPRQDRNSITHQYKRMLLQLSGYVSMASNDDPAIMERSGFDLTKDKTTVGVPARVVNVTTTRPQFDGEMDVRWQSVPGAYTYTVQYRMADSSEWSYVSSTKVRTTVSFLEQRKDYFFRVAAVGAAGQGPWSVEVPAFVV